MDVPPTRTAARRQTGSAGERLLAILDTLVRTGRPLSLPELTQAVGLPKPTVFRLIRLLETLGYAIKDPQAGRYVPGPTMHTLALALLQSRPNTAARHVVLQQLAERVGEACNLVLLDGDQMTYIDRVDTAWPLRLRFEIGSHVPLHCTATGKLLLSLQPKRVREQLLRHVPLQALTPRSITDPAVLEQALQRISQHRVGTDDQEFLPEMVAIAVPIEPPHGPPIAAVSIHAPIFRRSLNDLYTFLPQLQETGRALTAVMYADDASG